MSELRVRGGASIPCPNCQGRTRVMQTRRNPDKTVRRERTCLSCDIIFDTNEKPISAAGVGWMDRTGPIIDACGALPLPALPLGSGGR